jgi:nicotinamide phosphoribosyltransferase
MKNNIILNTDSYKYSQWNQYPPNTTGIYSYIESRGGIWDSTVFFGLQAFIKEYLLDPITIDDINEAEEIITAHGEPFYREGWEYILNTHNGMLPIIIKAVPEGSVVPVRNVLVTVENTDPKCYWLTSFLETALLRAVWYPTTVATNSYESKKIILDSLKRTGDPSLINFKLHDFGARGVSSNESASIGGAAHLVNFMGTDTVAGLIFARKYYDAKVAGFSIPAMEHSTVTSWGQENEIESYRNMLNMYAKPGAIIAAVSDSYDIYNACEMWGTVLKKQIIDSGATLVVRPDSGNPSHVVVSCLEILDEYFGHTINDKGYRVLHPSVRVIQGDGIDHQSIKSILWNMEMKNYSADNVAFGQGGALLQQINRDTMRFAMKCSAAKIDDKWVGVSKDPITDKGKQSKKGRVTLYHEKHKGYYSGVEDWMTPVLETVFLNGKLIKSYTFDEVRKNAQM